MKDEILAAYHRIAPLVRQTPLEHSAELGAYLKLEHLQHTGSFKFRGAANRIGLLTPRQAAAGVVTASNGNHGLGVAAAAQGRGIAAEVFVSSHVSPAKAARIEARGARIHCAGDDPLTAELAARRAASSAVKGSSPAQCMRAPIASMRRTLAAETWEETKTSAAMPRACDAAATPKP